MRVFTGLLAALAMMPTFAAELRQPSIAVDAIVGVRVVTEPGTVLDNATVVVRDGLIEAVGRDLEIPADARVIEFERGEDAPPLTLYPGLIEPYLALDIELPDEDETPPGRHPLIRADFAFDPAHWPAESIEAHRRAGFTTALIAPATGLLRGRSLLANLGDGGLAANLLREDVAQHGHLRERAPGGVYPQSLMGAVALFRQTLLDATWQARARAAWQRNPAQARPDWIAGVDALAPVLAGRQPLVMVADDPLDSLRVLEHVPAEVALVLVGHGHEYQRLASFPRKPLHILPLDFPDAPDVKDENDRDVSLEDLRHWQRAPENPARLVEAGFPLLLTAWQQSAPGDLLPAVARAIEHGLDADRALAALTTDAARWLGIDGFAGRIRPGYMANLVLVEGDLFTEKPSLREVWVDGLRFELAKSEPPEVDPAGTWALTLTFGSMGDVDGELTLTGPPTGMQGSLSVMGNNSEITEARVSGKQLRLRIASGQGNVSINLDIDGDRARGTGSGPFGEFSVRGQRSGPGIEEVQS
ncbi:MAG: amidohydrolase family protein [Wenzhouxiangellaceae bacterium]|nr:amidohydrolase family protein [Wenzhouxiangellaceae bacterium]